MFDDLGYGTWIVTIKEGSATARSVKKLNPKFSEVIAALHYLEDGMVNAMSKKSEMRCSSVAISEKEQKAWATFKKTMGKDMPKHFETASLFEIAEAGTRYLKEQIEKASTKHIPVSEINTTTRKKKEKEVKENNSISDLEVWLFLMYNISMSNLQVNDVVKYSGKEHIVKAMNGSLLTLRKVFGKQFVITVPSYMVNERNFHRIVILKMFV